jgi:hypothetical protein
LEKSAGDIFNAAGMTTPTVHLTRQRLNGKLLDGDLQLLVVHSDAKWSQEAARLSATQKDDLLQAHVGRWLLGDHDGKAANHLLLNDGHVMPIDLGNMYRQFPNDRLDRFYQPNPDPTAYAGLFDAYVNGKTTLDFNAGMAQVSRFEAMPDAQFDALLRPYAMARYAANDPAPGLKTVNDFMQAALARKHALRADMQEFYDGLQSNRDFRVRAATGLKDYKFRVAGDQSAIRGGHTPKTIVLDQKGQPWLSTPAPLSEKYRAIAQVTSSDVARAVGLVTPEVHPYATQIRGAEWFGSPCSK